LLDGMNPRRLARRSPVTRDGRISAPLRRRRRGKACAAAIGGLGGDLAHDAPAYGVVSGGEVARDPKVEAPAPMQEAALG
jgi:hypothetical protein